MKALSIKHGPIWTLTLLLLVIVPVVFQAWFMAPLTGKHAWAQGDHLAIAMKYAEHPNFFVPHSYNLAPDFMGEEQTDFSSGITRADFPLPHWITGMIMAMSGSNSAWIARVVFYLFSIAGLLVWAGFIFRTSSRSWLWFLVIGGFFAGPLWIFFASATLPSCVALSTLMGALVGFERYRQEPTAKRLLLTIALLALAAMMRPPFVAFGVGFAVWILLEGHLKRLRTWWVMGSVFVLALGYALHSISLGSAHGSLFLSNVDWGKTTIELIQLWWLGVSDHLRLILLVLVPALASLVLVIWKKGLKNSEWIAGIAVLLVSLTYQYLVAPQFIRHDYYLLDTWVPLCLVTLHFARGLWQGRQLQVLAVALPLLAWVAWNTHGERYSRDPSVQYELDRAQTAFLLSNGFMDQLAIPDSAKVLVLEAFSTNLPLVNLERNGFMVARTNEASAEEALKLDWDYVVMPIEALGKSWAKPFSELDQNQPHACIGWNGLLVAYKRMTAPEDWKQVVEPDFRQTGTSQFVLNSQPYSGSEEFPISVKVDTPLEGFAMHLHAGVRVNDATREAQLVIKSKHGYKSWPLWKGQMQSVLPLPVDGGPYEAYIWNPSNEALDLGELEFEARTFPLKK